MRVLQVFLNIHVITSGVCFLNIDAGQSKRKSNTHGPDITFFFFCLYPQSASLVWSPSSSVPLRRRASIGGRAASIRGPTGPFEPPHNASLCTLNTQNCGLRHAAHFQLQRGVGAAVASLLVELVRTQRLQDWRSRLQGHEASTVALNSWADWSTGLRWVYPARPMLCAGSPYWGRGCTTPSSVRRSFISRQLASVDVHSPWKYTLYDTLQLPSLKS